MEGTVLLLQWPIQARSDNSFFMMEKEEVSHPPFAAIPLFSHFDVQQQFLWSFTPAFYRDPCYLPLHE